MQIKSKNNRNPRTLMLASMFLLAVTVELFGQNKEQLYHTNIIPEHYNSALGSKDFLSVYTFHRTQWSNISSSPQTTGIGAHWAVFPKLSTQLYFASDAIQSVKNQNFKLGFTYALGRENDLRFSLRFGLVRLIQSSDFSAVDPVDNDPVLQNFVGASSSADADVSAAYGRNDWLLGISVNNLLKSGVQEFGINNERVLSVYVENLWGFRIFRSVQLKTFIHYKSELQTVSSGVLEIGNLFKFNPKIAVGAGYRFNESIPLLFQYKGNASNIPFVFQYSYDVQIGGLSNYNVGSHEISLRINLRSRSIIDTDVENEDGNRKSKNVRFL